MTDAKPESPRDPPSADDQLPYDQRVAAATEAARQVTDYFRE